MKKKIGLLKLIWIGFNCIYSGISLAIIPFCFNKYGGGSFFSLIFVSLIYFGICYFLLETYYLSGKKNSFEYIKYVLGNEGNFLIELILFFISLLTTIILEKLIISQIFLILKIKNENKKYYNILLLFSFFLRLKKDNIKEKIKDLSRIIKNIFSLGIIINSIFFFKKFNFKNFYGIFHSFPTFFFILSGFEILFSFSKNLKNEKEKLKKFIYGTLFISIFFFIIITLSIFLTMEEIKEKVSFSETIIFFLKKNFKGILLKINFFFYFFFMLGTILEWDELIHHSLIEMSEKKIFGLKKILKINSNFINLTIFLIKIIFFIFIDIEIILNICSNLTIFLFTIIIYFLNYFYRILYKKLNLIKKIGIIILTLFLNFLIIIENKFYFSFLIHYFFLYVYFSINKKNMKKKIFYFFIFSIIRLNLISYSLLKINFNFIILLILINFLIDERIKKIDKKKTDDYLREELEYD